MIMDIKVELTSKEYGDHVVVVYFPSHQMLIDRTAIYTEECRALLAMAEEIQTLREQLAIGKRLLAEQMELTNERTKICIELRAKVEVLVEALRGAEAIVKSAILLEGEVEPYISESVYELNGCLGENAPNISVRGRGVLNKITEAIATYDKLSEV